jgi:hypothetical protein|tara:strand:+ start:217 stop:444 length:228 start_codon:yes stop_codon:yes gene_type:complete
MNEIRELGDDQWKWLNKFGFIHLNQWRRIHVSAPGDKIAWMYVGDWKPDSNLPGDGYPERKKNLISNRYYYWPDR